MENNNNNNHSYNNNEILLIIVQCNELKTILGLLCVGMLFRCDQKLANFKS